MIQIAKRSVAAYVRVSSDKQDVTRQRESINRWTQTNAAVSHWFEDSTGRNPRDLAAKRPQFQAMLKAVQAGEISTIVVDSQDRFGVKDAFEWGKFMSILRDHDCRLIDCAGRELSADDDGAVLTTVVGALTSTREQKEKAHRNIGGKIEKAKRGEYQGGNPPYGFDVVCFGADGSEKWRSVYVGHYKRWKVSPDGKREAFNGKGNSPRKDPTDVMFLRPTIERERITIAKQIFSWYGDDRLTTPFQIAARLNKLNVNPVFGESWDKVKILQMLRNPAYIGLPTWNKRGGSRFKEYVNGQIRDVTRTNGRVKLGRRRTSADLLHTDKPTFDPLTDKATWDAVQQKMKIASEAQLAIRKNSPRVDGLWLKPFLICGRCGRSMRADSGQSTTGSVPSYFCGTYGTYGTENKFGCRCHRVQHEILAAIVEQYMKDVTPTVRSLATDDGVEIALKPTRNAYHGASQRLTRVWVNFIDRVESQVSEREFAALLKAGKSFFDIYGIVFDRNRPRLERQIAAKERELDKMLDAFADLKGALRERAQSRMESLQAEIDGLKSQTVDLRGRLAELRAELSARRKALEAAEKALRQSAPGRQMADAIAGVVDRVVCHFQHAEPNKVKGMRSGKKKLGRTPNSYLEKVEIHPVSGAVSTFCTNGITQGQD